MPRGLISTNTQRWLASLAVLSFAIRALVPLGFMPSADQPFTLQICPDGFPARLLPHETVHGSHHLHQSAAEDTGSSDSSSHDHESWRGQHCVFAAVASAPAPAHTSFVAFAFDTSRPHERDLDSWFVTEPRFRLPQPRAPPHFS